MYQQLSSWEPAGAGEGRATLAFLLARAVMRTRTEECEEALNQLEEVEEVKEENARLAGAIKKMKDKQGDKESNIEVLD